MSVLTVGDRVKLAHAGNRDWLVISSRDPQYAEYLISEMGGCNRQTRAGREELTLIACGI
jgi:hypothetical protein